LPFLNQIIQVFKQRLLFLQFNKQASKMTDSKQIIFPQNFDIKVIVAATVPIEESKANISRVFGDCQTVHSFVSARASAKGNYITYTYNIDLESQEQMNTVYDGLKSVPEIKFAL